MIRPTISPLPYVDTDQNVHPGLIYGTPPLCKMCASRACHEAYAQNTKQIAQCFKGVHYFKTIGPDDEAIVWIGFLIKGVKYPINFKELIKMGSIEITEKELRTLELRFRPDGDMASKISEIRRAGQSQSLHDLTPLITVMTRLLERYEIREAQEATNPSAAQVEVLQKLSFELFQLLGAIKNQIDLADFVIAPDTLSHSAKAVRSLHGLWYKSMRIYNILAQGDSKEITVGQFPPGYQNNVLMTDAFPLLPAILFDNAIKYSPKESSINVSFWGDHDDLTTTVSSFGVVVPEEKRNDMWKLGGRVTYSNLASRPGSGFGLYLAKRICELSNFTISYEADVTTNIRGNPAGYNRFHVRHKGNRKQI